MNRILSTGLALTGLSIAVIINAYQKKHQFFPLCMYLIQSNASYMVLICTFLFYSFLAARSLQRLLFSDLRVIEVEVKMQFIIPSQFIEIYF